VRLRNRTPKSPLQISEVSKTEKRGKSQTQMPKSVIHFDIVECLLGNATNNLWVLDLILDLLDIRQAELQLLVIITLLILL
jgi:hypothetical protein